MKKRILSFFLAVMIMFTVFVPAPALVSATTDNFFLPPDNSETSLFSIDVSIVENYYNNIALEYKDIYIHVYNEIIKNVLPDLNIDGSREQATLGFINTVDKDCYIIVSSGPMVWYKNDSGQVRLKRQNTSFAYRVISVGLDSNYNYMNKTSHTSSGEQYQGTNEIFFLPSFYDIAFPTESEDETEESSKKYKLYGVLVGQEVDKLGFFEWFKENNKIDYVKSCGFDLAVSQIEYIIDWWSEYGTSPLRIALGLPSLISKINIISWDISLATELVNIFDTLYLEYQEYLKKDEREAIEVGYNNVSHPHWRNPDSETDLTTDTEEDDTIVSLLREILRTLVYLPDDIAIHLSYIETYFDAILIDFNRLLAYLDSLPDYISTSAYNVFIEPINLIIEALGNVGTSNNIEIEIPETKKDEVDLFFDEWHTNFSEKLNSKIPVFTQLSELFNDNFFEQCGLDVNDDGEVYQYFTAGSVSSSGSTSDEVAAVESLLLQFDKADTNFANIEYSGDIPDGWTVTIAGNDIEIFDFKVFARYRSKIHIIIVFVAYTAYLLSLFKSLPTIIGNVSDVHNAFTSHEQSRNKEE